MEQIFKVGKLETLDNIDLKIERCDYETSSFIDGKSVKMKKSCLSFEIGNDDTGFSFFSTIEPKDFLNFEMNKRIDFKEYINYDDFDLGVNGKPIIIDSINGENIHYLDRKFMIVLYVQSDSVATHIQIDFDISEYLD